MYMCLNQLSVCSTFTWKQIYTPQFESVTSCHLSGLCLLGRATEESISLPVNITFNRSYARLLTESKKCIPGIFLYQISSICIHSRPLKMKQVSLEDQVLLSVFGQYYPLLKFLGLIGNSWPLKRILSTARLRQLHLGYFRLKLGSNWQQQRVPALGGWHHERKWTAVGNCGRVSGEYCRGF